MFSQCINISNSSIIRSWFSWNKYGCEQLIFDLIWDSEIMYGNRIHIHLLFDSIESALLIFDLVIPDGAKLSLLFETTVVSHLEHRNSRPRSRQLAFGRAAGGILTRFALLRGWAHCSSQICMFISHLIRKAWISHCCHNCLVIYGDWHLLINCHVNSIWYIMLYLLMPILANWSYWDTIFVSQTRGSSQSWGGPRGRGGNQRGSSGLEEWPGNGPM